MPDEPQLDARVLFTLLHTHLVGGEPDDVLPTQSQYDLAAGHKAILAASHALVEDDFGVCEILNPEDHADTWQDWAKRVERSLVLIRWCSKDDPDGDVGWVHRVRLIPITEEQYEELEPQLRANNLPESPPAWVSTAYHAVTDTLAETSTNVSTRMECSLCGSREVYLHGVVTHRISAQAGQRNQEDGSQVITTLGSVNQDKQFEAHLHCESCQGRAEIENVEMIQMGHDH